MSNHGILIVLLATLVLATSSSHAQAADGAVLPTPQEVMDSASEGAHHTVGEVHDIIDQTTRAGEEDGGTDEGAGDDGAGGTSDGDSFMSTLVGPGGLVALATVAAAVLAGAGFLFATRYVDPKEALENPQRAMLYGCIKGRAGVNLKQLSEDFDMKTSTVLWHIRKLEGAELVRSTKANGLRVFYPVEGGVEAKKLGSAVAALANGNATRILDYITVHPGVTQKSVISALGINAGTVRWHLRKLKEVGLMAELSQGRSASYYPTELGLKALKQTAGLSTDVKPIPGFVAALSAPQ